MTSRRYLSTTCCLRWGRATRQEFTARGLRAEASKSWLNEDGRRGYEKTPVDM